MRCVLPHIARPWTPLTAEIFWCSQTGITLVSINWDWWMDWCWFTYCKLMCTQLFLGKKFCSDKAFYILVISWARLRKSCLHKNPLYSHLKLKIYYSMKNKMLLKTHTMKLHHSIYLRIECSSTFMSSQQIIFWLGAQKSWLHTAWGALMMVTKVTSMLKGWSTVVSNSFLPKHATLHTRMLFLFAINWDENVRLNIIQTKSQIDLGKSCLIQDIDVFLPRYWCIFF